jgi:hypothetical protein
MNIGADQAESVFGNKRAALALPWMVSSSIDISRLTALLGLIPHKRGSQ